MHDNVPNLTIADIQFNYALQLAQTILFDAIDLDFSTLQVASSKITVANQPPLLLLIISDLNKISFTT